MSNFSQLCVWEGTTIIKNDESGMGIPSDDDIKAFEDFMKSNFDITAKFENEVKTKPDKDEFGHYIDGTGGRKDLFFYVADEDIAKFALPRLKFGIRWWEDVIYNGGEGIYPDDFVEAHPKTW